MSLCIVCKYIYSVRIYIYVHIVCMYIYIYTLHIYIYIHYMYTYLSMHTICIMYRGIYHVIPVLGITRQWPPAPFRMPPALPRVLWCCWWGAGRRSRCHGVGCGGWWGNLLGYSRWFNSDIHLIESHIFKSNRYQ